MGMTQPGPGQGFAHEWTIRDGGRGPSNLHPLVFVQSNGRSAWVDEGIASSVRTLWNAGIDTTGSCQGDANYSRYIDLARVEDLARGAELLSAWVVEVERQNPFTLRGFYDDTCSRSVPNPPAAIWSGLA